MPTSPRAYSLRAHILVIVLAGAVVPLALAGLWVTFSGVRSGEALLGEHLAASASRFAAAIDARWQYRQADLLLLAENEVAGRLFSGAPVTAADSQYLDQLVASVQPAIRAVEYRDGGSVVRWSSTVRAPSRPTGPGSEGSAPPAVSPSIVFRFPVPGAAGSGVGEMVATTELSALVPADSLRPLVPGSRLALRDLSSGSTLIPFGVGESFPAEGAISVNGERWLAVRRRMDGPPLEIVIGAPVDAYVEPFEHAARVGAAALALATLLALALTALLATRLTASLRQLVQAADGVSRGALDQTVAPAGPREIRHVGTAFNLMTESLRKTLAELSHRTALAAVGEFATSLSHEVRNTLTSIRLDLQRAAKKPPGDAAGRDLVLRALDNIAHLDASVSGALRVARSAHAALAPVDVRNVLHAAAGVVAGTFAAVPATLDLDGVGGEPITVRGDALALEQLFSNLLFNAAQALRPDGRAVMTASVDGTHAVISIADNGVGMDEQQVAALRLPFSSSKSYGTGVGLAIARQICAAHEGELTISSTVGVGTTVEVRMPLISPRDGPATPLS